MIMPGRKTPGAKIKKCTIETTGIGGEHRPSCRAGTGTGNFSGADNLPVGESRKEFNYHRSYRDRQNLSYLACALGEKACREGFSTLYKRVQRFVHELAIARADGSYLKLLAQLAKVELLILDDWALSPLEGQAQQDILEVIDDRVDGRSTMVTSQLPVEKWYDMMGDPSTADALFDRLLGKATKINLKGGSLRKEGKTESKKE
jgi:hypothetical protein